MADIRDLATAAAQRYGVPSDLFLRLVNTESGFDPSKVSSAGAVGPAQLMPSTAQGLGVNPNDPAQNLDGGAHYLSQQHDRFGSWPLAVAAYNAGPTRVVKAHGVPNIPETQAYVQKVMGNGQVDDTMPSAADLLGSQGAPHVVPQPAQPQPAAAPQGQQPDDAVPSASDLVSAAPQQAPTPRSVVPMTAAPNLNPEAVADVKKLNASVPGWEVPLAQGASYNWAPKLGAEMVKGETWFNNNVAPIFAGHKTGYTGQEAYDAYLADAKARAAAYAKAHPKADAALNILGGLAAPGMKGLGKLGAAGGGAVAGGLSGVGSADPGNEGLAGTIGAGTGALVGLVAPPLAQGVAKATTAAARPVVNAVSDWTSGALPKIAPPNFIPQNARQQLVNEGVDLTMGQAFPWLKPVEGVVSKLPFVGGGVQAAQGRSVASFNTAALNKALAPISEQIPKDIKPGNDAVQYVQQRLGDAYDTTLGRIKSVDADKQFNAELQGAKAGTTTVPGTGKTIPGIPLSQPEAARLSSVTKWVQQAFGSGSVDGRTLKHLTSEIGKEIGPTNSTELNNRLQAIRSAINSAAARSNPNEAANLANIDAGYSNLVRLQKAASAASNTGGVFTPAQLSQKVVAADKSANKRVSAAGQAPMQDFAQQGKAVLGNAKPGGASGGGHGGGLVAGLLGGELLEPWLAHHPASAAATTGLLGLATLPYTPAGQKVISQMVGKGATDVGNGVRTYVQKNVPALLPYIQGLLPQPSPSAATSR